MLQEKMDIGSHIPTFKLESVDGNFYSENDFDSFNGILVIFACNHCPYVIAYEDRIIEIHKKYKNELALVMINSNDSEKYPEDSFDNMKKRAEEKNYEFPYLRDETQKIAKVFKATHTPEVFLFNNERKLAYTGKIDDNYKEPENVQTKYLENAIKEVLSGKEVSMPETFSIGCTIKWK